MVLQWEHDNREAPQMSLHQLWHMAYSSNYVGWEAGRYIGIALVVLFAKFRQHVLPHLPHFHDGYVSLNGSVWNCTKCGKAPKNVEAQLAEVRAEMAEHRWMGPYMGPDREPALMNEDDPGWPEWANAAQRAANATYWQRRGERIRHTRRITLFRWFDRRLVLTYTPRKYR